VGVGDQGSQLWLWVGGCWLCSVDKDKRKKTHLFLFPGSVSGAVSADVVGQVVSHVCGWWLDDDGGGSHSGMWWSGLGRHKT
jgi:hypothetical protein